MSDFLVAEIQAKAPASRPVSLVPRLTPSSAIEFTSPPWLPAMERRVNELLLLQENWDGEGASPINFECAMGAFAFLFTNSMHETPAPHMVPTSAGGVQIEWHSVGIDFEIRFDPNEPPTYYYFGADGKEIEGEVSEEPSTVGSLLRALPTRNERIQPSR